MGVLGFGIRRCQLADPACLVRMTPSGPARLPGDPPRGIPAPHAWATKTLELPPRSARNADKAGGPQGAGAPACPSRARRPWILHLRWRGSRRGACPTLLHLSHLIAPVPPYCTCPTLWHLSHLIAPVPPCCTCPTLWHLPPEPRISVYLSSLVVAPRHPRLLQDPRLCRDQESVET